MGSLGSYRELIGLAAAKMDVRAFRVVMIPALAIETVCCSYSLAPVTVNSNGEGHTMTSCRTERVESDILSNSSIQHTPPSERTSAPLSCQLKLFHKEDPSLPLEYELLRVGITGNVGSQTDCRRSLTRGVDASRCDLVHILHHQLNSPRNGTKNLT
jgi:hypothetical protein